MRAASCVPGASAPAPQRAGAAAPAAPAAATATAGAGPFAGLVVCVTGLSKAARRQVLEATEAMGGAYSPELHLRCTHLVVHICAGHKFEHALKHGVRRGLYVVTVAWFVNCARQHARLDEAHYTVPGAAAAGGLLQQHQHSDKEKLLARSGTGSGSPGAFCLPPGFMSSLTINGNGSSGSRDSSGQRHHPPPAPAPVARQEVAPLAGMCLFVDADVAAAGRQQVLAAAAAGGATTLDHWFIGCAATHVVCDTAAAALKYMGGGGAHLVSPAWVLRAAKDGGNGNGAGAHRCCVHVSPDLARQLASRALEEEHHQDHINGGGGQGQAAATATATLLRRRQEEASAARAGVRRRRRAAGALLAITGARAAGAAGTAGAGGGGHPVSPACLLDTVCWSVTEAPDTATMFVTTGANGDADADDEDGDAAVAAVLLSSSASSSSSEGGGFRTRPMSEADKWEVVYWPTFLTVLFPVDQFGEMGPTARTFVSQGGGGFTRLQIIHYVSTFYQVNDDE